MDKFTLMLVKLSRRVKSFRQNNQIEKTFSALFASFHLQLNIRFTISDTGVSNSNTPGKMAPLAVFK